LGLPSPRAGLGRILHPEPPAHHPRLL
jgi:hypothetical protein